MTRDIKPASVCDYVCGRFDGCTPDILLVYARLLQYQMGAWQRCKNYAVVVWTRVEEVKMRWE